MTHGMKAKQIFRNTQQILLNLLSVELILYCTVVEYYVEFRSNVNPSITAGHMEHSTTHQ